LAVIFNHFVHHSKRKILIINNSSKLSGAEVSLLAFVDALGQPEVFTVAIPSAEGDLYDELLSRNIRVEKFALRRFSRAWALISKIGYLLQVLRTSAKLARLVRKEKIDLIYANSNQSLPYAVGVRLLTGKMTVWHVRDKIDNRFVARFLSSLVNKVICISEFIAGQFPQIKGRKHLVYNGINTEHWAPFAKTGFLHKQLGLPPGTLLVGQAGQLLPWKNHSDLIKLAALVAPLFPNVHFVIIGEDLFGENREYVNGLKALIEERGLTARISFLGYRKNIRDCMNDLDLLAHFALHEPFGRVVMEALSLEKPVVAYDSGGVKEIVHDSKTGFLVPPKNYTEAAKKLMMLLEDESLRRSLGIQGRKDVHERFSAEAMTNNLKDILGLKGKG
jgi:glycosyltransferase involved in cell wall biosynthesis